MLEGPDVFIDEAASGPEVLSIVRRGGIDLVVADLQIGAMGGMAICMEIRHDESYMPGDPVSVLMLLDRRADVFLARRSGADGFLVKPLDPQRGRRAVRTLLSGGEGVSPTISSARPGGAVAPKKKGPPPAPRPGGVRRGGGPPPLRN